MRWCLVAAALAHEGVVFDGSAAPSCSAALRNADVPSDMRAAALAFYLARPSPETRKACAEAWKRATTDDALELAVALEAAATPRRPRPRALPAGFVGPGPFERRTSTPFDKDAACSPVGAAGSVARSDDCPLGPPPARSLAPLPALLEPRVQLWWPELARVAEIAQDGFLRPYNPSTTLWPAGAVLAHAVQGDCAAWKGTRVLELGAGVGAAAVALAACGATVVAADASLAALALVAENGGANGAAVSPLGAAAMPGHGRIVPYRLDWTSEAQLRAVQEAHGPFEAVVGAALKFESWPPGRLVAVLDRLARGRVVLAHAWGDAAPDLGDAWIYSESCPGWELGLDEFSAVFYTRRQPSFKPPTSHPSKYEL